MRLPLALLMMTSLAARPAAADSPQELAAKAEAVLRSSCVRCHSAGGSAEKTFGSILDTENLIRRGLITPGDPFASRLIAKVVSGEMPPGGPALGAAGTKSLRDWVSSLSLGSTAAQPVSASCKSDEEILDVAAEDLRSVPSADRPFIRYVALDPGQSKLQRDAAIRVLNSVSRSPRLVVPKASTGNTNVLRIDLRDFGWVQAQWAAVEKQNPFIETVQKSMRTRRLATEMGTNLPFVRADWLAATASKPPLYHELAGIPSKLGDLETQLGVNRAQDVKDGRAARSGFRDSGVSQNNRIIERHATKDGGSYWISHDFANNQDKKNIFSHPTDFEANGGEVIYSLPNGMQGYVLVNAAGDRIDQAPTAIVTDPRRKDKTVTNGVSCMRCHAGGLLPHGDQLRAAVEANPGLHGKGVLEQVRRLHVPANEFSALIGGDTGRHAKALRALGQDPAEDPVTAVVEAFDDDVGLARAACEMGFDDRDLVDLVGLGQQGLGDLTRLAACDLVPRDTLLAQIDDVARIRGTGPAVALALTKGRGLLRGKGSAATGAEVQRAIESQQIDPDLYLALVRKLEGHGAALSNAKAVKAAAVDPGVYFEIRELIEKNKVPKNGHALAVKLAGDVKSGTLTLDDLQAFAAGVTDVNEAAEAARAAKADEIIAPPGGLYAKLRTNGPFKCGDIPHKVALEAAKKERSGEIRADRYFELVKTTSCHIEALRGSRSQRPVAQNP